GDDLKKSINLKISDLKDLMGKDDISPDDLKTATEALAAEAQEIGKIVYEAAQAKPEETNSAAEDAGEKVVDAEVVDDKVDEN
ncbi:MAG: molecular chaperone DnaK, partial [bacterium]|nr:molecular chaperone DnaK [bacterium]